MIKNTILGLMVITVLGFTGCGGDTNVDTSSINDVVQQKSDKVLTGSLEQPTTGLAYDALQRINEIRASGEGKTKNFTPINTPLQYNDKVSRVVTEWLHDRIDNGENPYDISAASKLEDNVTDTENTRAFKNTVFKNGITGGTYVSFNLIWSENQYDVNSLIEKIDLIFNFSDKGVCGYSSIIDIQNPKVINEKLMVIVCGDLREI
jgi:hypothetical protein